MPDGIKVSENTNNIKTLFHSFSLITRNSKRKHVKVLSFYENYEIFEYKFSLLKCLAIISPKPIYNTLKEILENIFSIITNYKINKTMFPEQLKYIYVKDKSKSYTVLKEYTNLEFYFSFILNSLKYSREEKSNYVNYIGNNAGKKCFLKYYINGKNGYNIVDYDMTLLLDRFNVEDLIKIYIGLLMEYKLIIVFDNYEEINLIMFSIISLLFPLKWKFPIVSFITPQLMETLEAPFGIIIGVHSKYLSVLTQKLKQKALNDETLIYNINSKTFIYLPEHFPELPLKIVNELRSSIYLILSEKLAISSDLENNETEIVKMFNCNTSKKIDPQIFINLKFIQIFYNVFLELTKNVDSSIYFNKVKSYKAVSGKFQLQDVFDNTKFLHDREYHNDKKYKSFLEQFSKTLIFMEFLEKYIRNSEKKNKYGFVKKFISILSTKENGKNFIKDLNREYIKNKITNYYNVSY